jgi:membrane glycosyltransferase
MGVQTIHAEADTPRLDAGWALLPAESPLQMPEQTLREGTEGPSAPHLAAPDRPAPAVHLRRHAGMTAVATRMMWRVLSANGISVLEACLLVLFVGLFAWIALSFASAVAGFLTAVFDRGYRLGIDPDKPLPTVHSRTALLMPTYNETRAACWRACRRSTSRWRPPASSTVRLLRAQRYPARGHRRAEEQVFAELRERVPDGQTRLFYRRRGDNSGRKAGNIADWVRRFGGAYPQMLILDADSLMTGDSIVRLVAGMEHNADVGLIQTLPSVIGGRTLFARMQQFGGRVYGR